MFRYHDQLNNLLLADGVMQVVSFSKENTLVEDIALWLNTPGIDNAGGDTLDWVVKFNGIAVNNNTHPLVPATEKAPQKVWNYVGAVPIDTVTITVELTFNSGGATDLVCRTVFVGTIKNPLG